MKKTVLTLAFSVTVISSLACATNAIQMPEENDHCTLGLTLPSTCIQSTFSFKEQWAEENDEAINGRDANRKSFFGRTVAKFNLLAKKTYTRLSFISERLSEEALIKHPQFGAVILENQDGGVIFAKHPKGFSNKPLLFNQELKAWYAPADDGTLVFPRDRKSKKIIIMHPGEIAVAFTIKKDGNLSPNGNYAGLNEKELCDRAMSEIIEREF